MLRCLLSFLLFPLTVLADGSVRISEVKIYDQGDLTNSSFSIDIKQNVCDDSDGEILEPFFDTIVGLSVTNESRRTIRFRGARFIIRNADGAGRRFRTKRLRLLSTGEAPGNDAVTELYAFFMETTDTDKIYAGADFLLPSDPGFTTVRVRLRGRDETGQRYRLRTRMSVSLDDIERCS